MKTTTTNTKKTTNKATTNNRAQRSTVDTAFNEFNKMLLNIDNIDINSDYFFNTVDRVVRIAQHSVLKKVIDPQCKKTTVEFNSDNSYYMPSNNGYNTKLVSLKNSLDRTLDEIQAHYKISRNGNGITAVYNKDGEIVYKITDADAYRLYNENLNNFVIDTRLNDCMDLYQELWTAFLECIKHYKSLTVKPRDYLTADFKVSNFKDCNILYNHSAQRSTDNKDTTPFNQCKKHLRRTIDKEKTYNPDQYRDIYFSEFTDADGEIIKKLPPYLIDFVTVEYIDTCNNSRVDVDNNQIKAIKELIKSIQQKPQDLVIIHALMQGWSENEIAEKFGITRNAVHGKITRLKARTVKLYQSLQELNKE